MLIIFPDARQEYKVNNQDNFRIPEEIEEQIHNLFSQIDTDNSGDIDKNEFKKALALIGSNISEGDIGKIFERFDKNGNGTITYDEFRLLMEDRMKQEMKKATDI